MATPIWIKVVGFNDAERNSLNTLFRISNRTNTSYVLWSPELSVPPHVALIDVDSYAARLEMASPSFNTHQKLIGVGAQALENAWCSFERPVDWSALLQSLDALFSPPLEIDIDLGITELMDTRPPPGIRVSLLVGMDREQRLYLRARLALAGLVDVDESETALEAGTKIHQRHYDLVILGLELKDANPWDLVQTLRAQPGAPCSVIVTTVAPSWNAMEQAEQSGCTGLLEIPFDPRQVIELLQKV